jgi:AI-2 transport protein TqsA
MEQRIQTVSLLILAAIAAAASLYWLRPVLIPFVLALFITLGLSVVLDWQVRRLKVPRTAALVGTFLVGVLLFIVLATLVSISVGQLVANAPAYEAKVQTLVKTVFNAVPVEFMGFTRANVFERINQAAVGAARDLLVGTANAIFSTLSQSILVSLFVAFLLVGGQRAKPTTSRVWREIELRTRRYIVMKVLISSATGGLVTLTLALLGIDLALVFGLFAFLLNFIPSIGSIVATLLPLPVVVVSPDVTMPTAILAIAIPGAIQFVVGSLIEPQIMGESLDLHPVTILMALIFWGMLWGIVGALLAAPMTAVLQILCKRLETTAPLAELMAGRFSNVARAGESSG